MSLYNHNEECTALDIGFREDEKLLNSLPAAKRIWWKLITVSLHNPHAITFYRSEKQIRTARLEQMEGNYYYIIHPFSHLRAWYMMFQIFLYALAIILKTYEAAFAKKWIPNNIITKVNFGLTGITILDLIIQFFVAFIKNKEEVIFDQKLIVVNYLFGPYFACDLWSSIPAYTSSSVNIIGIVSILSSFRIIRLVTIIRNIKYLTYLYGIRTEKTVVLICAMMSFLLLCHFLTCLQVTVFNITQK